MVGQVAGGLMGGYLSKTIVPSLLAEQNPVCWSNEHDDDFARLTESQVLYFEFLLSSIIYIILLGLLFTERRSIVTNKWGNIYGLASFVSVLAGSRWIGLSCNPLFSLAISLSQNCEDKSLLWIHWLATVLAAIAATVFHLLQDWLLEKIRKKKIFNFGSSRSNNTDDDDDDFARSEITNFSRASF